MPYTDQQIEALQATDPAIVREAFAKMSEGQRSDLFAAVEAYNKRKTTTTVNPEGGLSRISPVASTQSVPSVKKPSLLEHIVFSTPVQAITDIPLAAAQLALSGPDTIAGLPTSPLAATGLRGKARDYIQNTINQREAQYKALPENQNVIGDLNRGIINTAAGMALVPGMTKAPAIAQGAAGAMMTPVEGTPEDVAKGKLMQGGAGAVTAGIVQQGAKIAGKGVGIAKRAFGPGEDFSPEAVLAKFKGKIQGRASDVLQEDLSNQYGAARREASKAFQDLRTAAGTNEVPVPTYQKTIDDIIAKEESSRAGADKAVLAKLQSLRDALSNPNADKSFGGTMDVGSRLNAIYGDAVHGSEPNRHLAGIVTELKTALQNDLDNAGQGFGQRYIDAKKLWQEKVIPWEDPKEGGRLLQNFIKSPTPDLAMDALLKAKSEDKIGLFVSKLSRDKGIPALQAGLVDSVYRQSLDEAGNVIPSTFLGALKARRDAYGLAFTGEAKWRMDGLAQLMRDSRFVSRVFSLELPMKAIPGNRAMPGSRFPTPDSGALLQKLFTSPQISKLLVESQGIKPNSPAMGRMIDQISARLGAVMGPRLTPKPEKNEDIQ